jgi:superfamily II DNA/RNA helicase
LLARDGLRAQAMHGDKSQAERLATLDAFKRNEVEVLVATDVAARGLDIAELPGVINYDVPFNAEDYVHRIGRTGRAGASGLAITLAAERDTRGLADIEKLIKRSIEVRELRLEPRSRRDARPGERSADRRDERRGGAAPRAPARSAQDPWFDKPYEVDPNANPGWEQSAAPGSRSSAPNIRTRRKVALLLGGKPPAGGN